MPHPEGGFRGDLYAFRAAIAHKARSWSRFQGRSHTHFPRVDGESMASFPDLRLGSRSARAESEAVRRRRSPFLLAVSAALLLTAFFAVSELATLRGAKAHDASAYLTRELGSPLSSASLVRAPARTSPALGGKVEIHGGGLNVTSGREALAFGVNRVEQSLLVDHRVGARTWQWQLQSSQAPRVTADGSVRFASS